MNTTKKALLKRIADYMEKLSVAGVALALFHGNSSGAWLAVFFFVISFILTIWEAKQ